ncbi:MAG: molecular chaperone HtpG [Hyphomicrobiaceae bacterium]
MSEADANAGAAGESHSYQAEVARLLHLMVHSVYTEREIFLRELISNASDACDKLRYEAITRDELLAADPDLAIGISLDPAAGVLSVIDNGIGMSRQELIDNLGTIARSGTRAFIEDVTRTQGAESQTGGSGLIGQFGVGFYAAFMVADHIEVVSRKAGESEAWLWASDGAGGFRVLPAPEARAANVRRGTEVRLTLKSDARRFLEAHEVERIVKAYSDHILFPVRLLAEGEARQLNSASALWHRSRNEIDEEAYKEAYRTLSGQFDEPALTLHYRVEGRQAYAVLLFVPGMRPYDLFDPSRKGRVKLYVRRVFITDDADLLPSYLRFVRGVVDSEDVPLNISREMLQNNPIVVAIRKALSGRVLSELASFAEKDGDGYEKVFETFGAVLKEGLYEEPERREALLDLCRFRTTAGDGWRSLKAYVADMKPGQSAIYYLAGDSQERLRSSPQLEACRARGVEVLLLSDAIDHFWTVATPKYADKSLVSLSQAEVDLSEVPLVGEAGPAEAAAPVGDPEALVRALEETLGERISGVRRSTRLVDSPVCLVSGAGGPERGLERLLARQQPGEGPRAPVLEINPSHRLIVSLERRLEAGDRDGFEDLAGVLLDQAFILDGELPKDPAAFSARLTRLMSGKS